MSAAESTPSDDPLMKLVVDPPTEAEMEWRKEAAYWRKTATERGRMIEALERRVEELEAEQEISGALR